MLALTFRNTSDLAGGRACMALYADLELEKGDDMRAMV